MDKQTNKLEKKFDSELKFSDFLYKQKGLFTNMIFFKVLSTDSIKLKLQFGMRLQSFTIVT